MKGIKMKKFLTPELNQNEGIIYQNLWDTVKAIVSGWCIVLS